MARRHRRNLPFLPSPTGDLCLSPTFTGWDLDGGYADVCLVDEAFAYRIPDGLADESAAPLLCAGIIGYRALQRAAVPDGGRLGIYGFGGSAHLTAQVALAQGLRVHVLSRGEHNQALARELGTDSVGGPANSPPEPLGGAITPVSWCSPRSPRWTAAGRSPGRDLVLRHPDPKLRPDALPGATADQCHGQHPYRRGDLPRAVGPARDQGHHPWRTRWPTPTKRWPT